MAETRIISDFPPQDGKDYECQCARCGSSADFIRCENCDDGFDGHDCGEDCCACAYPEDNVVCDICHGHCGWYACMSSPEWCKENPMDGREDIGRGNIEWFEVDRGEYDDDLSEEWGRQRDGR